MQGYPDIDTRMLDEQIKGIMMVSEGGGCKREDGSIRFPPLLLQKIIPVLKEDIEKTCTLEMVIALRDRVVGLVMEHEQQAGQVLHHYGGGGSGSLVRWCLLGVV